VQNLSPSEKTERIKRSIAEKPDGVLEFLADEHAVSLQFVLDCLPGTSTRRIDGVHFTDVLGDISEWGEVTLICHSKDSVIEFVGSLPPGKMGHGMYNLQGSKPGMSGHLRPERCKSIYFVRRPFMGMETLSVQFFNPAGEAIFKIYVGRDKDRQLRTDQVDRFAALEVRYPAAAARN
jgi:heme iron utilization protein